MLSLLGFALLSIMTLSLLLSINPAAELFYRLMMDYCRNACGIKLPCGVNSPLLFLLINEVICCT